VVAVQLKLPEGKVKICQLHDVLYVPDSSYNLPSVSNATEYGLIANISKGSCEIFRSDGAYHQCSFDFVIVIMTINQIK
jgi:hypothetical protein